MDVSEKNLNRVIVVDMDEVLINITPKWFSCIIDNLEKYSEYIDIELAEKSTLMLKLFPSLILTRGEYMLVESFSDFIHPHLDKEEVKKELNKEFLKYLEDENFYSDIPKNPLLKMLDIAVNIPDKVEKLIVLTKSFSDITDLSKIKIFNEWFKGNDKVELTMLRLDEKKSDYLNSIEYSLFIDDDPKNILDVIRNDIKGHHEFLVPGFLYSLLELKKYKEEIEKLNKTKANNLTFYKNIMDEKSITEINSITVEITEEEDEEGKDELESTF